MDGDQLTVGFENLTSQAPKIASTPTTPLKVLSPERLNQQRIPASPSLPANLGENVRPQSHRMSDAADVKARVAYLNAVSNHSSPTRSISPPKPAHSSAAHAAVQRAILGREEAETALNQITAQLDSARSRERMVSERVESLMEQLSQLRSRQKHERQVYEKEMRASKKSEYKAELALIKLQEQLREVKSELDGYKARADHDKAEKEKARQEAFERAYAIAGITEELQALKQKLQMVEQERDHAVATAASRMDMGGSEGTEKRHIIEAPIQSERKPPIHGKRKQPTTGIPYLDALEDDDDLEEVRLDDPNCPLDVKYAAALQELDYLHKQVQEGHAKIQFMHMQCQFLACPCRTAEQQGLRFVHDYAYDARMRAQNSKKRKVADDKPVQPFVPWSSHILNTKPVTELASGPAQELMKKIWGTPRPNKDEAEAKATRTNLPEASQVERVEPMVPLPPSQPNQTEVEVAHAEVYAAAQIPLPSPTISNPEVTAQLEEITQVIVEPGLSGAPFSFSTSITGKQKPLPVLDVCHSQDAGRISDDLFDLSPPKRHPPRPSTAMGILTVESPIRLVPGSPHFPLSLDDTAPTMMQFRTTRVALNDAEDSSRRQGGGRGARPPSQSRFRTRDLTAVPAIDSELAPQADDLASPASSTFFPMTPVVKNPQTHSGVQQQSPHSHSVLAETTTTTTVPLRGDEDTGELSASTTNASGAAAAAVMGPANPAFANLPGTPITREAALAQIRARRDRARSVNLRKNAEEDTGGDKRGLKTPGSAARRGVNLKDRLQLGGERGRDFSQVSAPGRM